MRLGSSAGRTDPGRKRRRNEDAYVVDPPLFTVADGMGGAQAGEVASRLAAAAFREYHEADDLEPEERLKAIIGEANRRIYERAQSDTEVTGMGTTVTAAHFEGAGVAIGHVGDSRAYRMRGGELKQLTSDHSLVADVMRSGRLTAEEAESHPQRSVITRALGTDPDIDVDTLTVDASPGDLFLLCSDGLTSMVPDDEILELLQKGRSLESVAKALVKAANRSGGEDNITVVLFSVEGEEALEETLARGDGCGSDEVLEDTLSGLPVPPELAAAGTAVVAPPTDEPAGWPEEPVEPAVAAPPKPPPPRRRRWPRRLFWAVVALTGVALLAAGALWGLSRANFVGADDEGNITVYQGVPFDFSDGVGLYRERYVSPLRASQLSPEERAELFDHELLSYDEARARVAELEEQLPETSP
jgi:serine/threonine protein phosphatase PrpC